MTSQISVWPSLVICYTIITYFLIAYRPFTSKQPLPFPWEKLQIKQSLWSSFFAELKSKPSRTYGLSAAQAILGLPASIPSKIRNEVREIKVLGFSVDGIHLMPFFVVLMLVISGLIALFKGIPFSWPPARDLHVLYFGSCLQFFAMIAVLWMIGFALLQTLVLRKLIVDLRTHLRSRIRLREAESVAAPLQPVSKRTQNQLRKQIEHHERLRGLRIKKWIDTSKDLLEWAEVATSKSANALLIPATFLLLFAISRLPIFDGWHVNASVLSTILIPFGLTLCAAYFVRRTAIRLREEVLVNLNEVHLNLVNQSSETISRDYLNAVITRVKGLNGGAFRDVIRDPILGSFLLFLSTAAAGPGQDLINYLARMVGFG